MDQRELLNKIINHKMVLQLFEAEQTQGTKADHIFTRNQMHLIEHARKEMGSDLLVAALRAQIASEEEMFHILNEH